MHILAAQAKSVYERELTVMVLVIRKWWPYLMGCRFTVRTDQRSLKHLLEQGIVEGEHHRWLLKLLSYDLIFSINWERKIRLLTLSRRLKSPWLCFQSPLFLTSTSWTSRLPRTHTWQISWESLPPTRLDITFLQN